MPVDPKSLARILAAMMADTKPRLNAGNGYAALNGEISGDMMDGAVQPYVGASVTPRSPFKPTYSAGIRGNFPLGGFNVAPSAEVMDLGGRPSPSMFIRARKDW